MVHEISSLQNELVKRAASLRTKKYRKREGMFLLEGKRALLEAMKADADVRGIFYTALPEDWPEDPEMSTVNYYHVTEPVLKKITDTEDPQSVAALIGLQRSSLETLQVEKGLVLVLDQIRDPGNLGTLIRTADAMGAAAVLLMENTADLYNPKVVRSTMGSLFHLPIVSGVKENALLDFCRKEKLPLWATALLGAEDVTKLPLPDKLALVLGSEANGVTETLLDKADQKVKIPMYGRAESLNVAVAGGILLFAAAKAMHGNPPLSKTAGYGIMP